MTNMLSYQRIKRPQRSSRTLFPRVNFLLTCLGVFVGANLLVKTNAEAQSSAQSSAPSSLPHCLCYDEVVNGAFSPVTTCRQTRDACLKLQAKVSRGTKKLKEGKQFKECRTIFTNAHPGDVLGDLKGWVKSKIPGNYFYPKSCLIKYYDPKPLKGGTFNQALEIYQNLTKSEAEFFERYDADRARLTEGVRRALKPPASLAKEWKVVTANGVTSTRLKAVKYEGCGASSCYLDLIFKDKIKSPIFSYPSGLFKRDPKAIHLQGESMSIGPELSSSTYAQLSLAIESEAAIIKGEEQTNLPKTFCNLNNMKRYRVKTHARYPYLLYCRSASVPNQSYSSHDRQLLKRLQTQSPIKELDDHQDQPIFSGVFLYDGSAEVKLIGGHWFNDARSQTAAPKLAIDFNHDALYQVLIDHSYYEGSGTTLIRADQGYVQTLTVLSDGA